jgi:hypothetical protein
MNASSLFTAELFELVELRDLPAAVTENIQVQITKLCQEYRYLIGCQAIVKAPASNREGCYHIQIVLNLSEKIYASGNRELTIDRLPNPDNYQEDIYVAIWSAFKLAKQKLQENSQIENYGASKSIDRHQSNSPVRNLRRSVGYAGG